MGVRAASWITCSLRISRMPGCGVSNCPLLHFERAATGGRGYADMPSKSPGFRAPALDLALAFFVGQEDAATGSPAALDPSPPPGLSWS